jgi:pimeloyl-ACP methyl ester carboxylesterase
VALIDDLGLRQCILIGHSMGGGVAVQVAAARSNVVTLLVMAEGSIDPGDGTFGGQTEAEFVEHGFAELLETQASEAEAKPQGIAAAHLGITRTSDARAIYREGRSLGRGSEPSIRALLAGLRMPRWYLQGEASAPEPDLRRDLVAMGVGWRVVPKTGHPMGLQNPIGLAATIAELV